MPPDASTTEKIRLRSDAISRLKERCGQRDIPGADEQHSVPAGPRWLPGPEGDVRGAIVLMDERAGEARTAVAAAGVACAGDGGEPEHDGAAR
jgi:hypothetical protein